MTKEEVFEEIKRNIFDILPELEGEEIKLSDSLRELGANSIDRADIIMSTLERFELKISMVSFGECSNIGDIVDVIASSK